MSSALFLLLKSPEIHQYVYMLLILHYNTLTDQQMFTKPIHIKKFPGLNQFIELVKVIQFTKL